jgi:hypothetical protein
LEFLQPATVKAVAQSSAIPETILIRGKRLLPGFIQVVAVYDIICVITMAAASFQSSARLDADMRHRPYSLRPRAGRIPKSPFRLRLAASADKPFVALQ